MSDPGSMVLHPHTLTHLERLEAESIQVMREVVAECEKPVMLYSIGKDSAVMLTRKASSRTSTRSRTARRSTPT